MKFEKIMAQLTRSNKYGEIILETENTFRIFCDLCTDTFLTMENFRYHIFKHLNSDSVEDRRHSFLDFIFKDDSDYNENLMKPKLEIEIDPIEIEHIKEENKNNLYNEENLEETLNNINESAELDASEDNILNTNIYKKPENHESDVLTATKHHKINIKSEYNTDNSDTDDSIKNFDNLKQKRDYDYNVIRRKLKDIFKIYKDYCPICLHTFADLRNLIKHTKIHLKDHNKERIIQIFKNSINYKNDDNATISSEDLEIFKCIHCEKSFVHQNDLQRHIRIIHLQNLKCSYCGQTFIYNNDLQLHVKFLHLEKLKCKLCNTLFDHATRFSRHMHNIHNIDEPFECNICPKTFTTCGLLTRHIRFHNNDLRYECEHCGKRFMENSQKKLHIRQHHTNEKLYQCDECGQGFSSLSGFKIHKLRHSNKREYKCTKCDKQFYKACFLKNHFRIHTKEKPFECEICNARFGNKGALWTHNRLHSNERKYQCKFCEKSFVQYAGLYSHMKTHCNNKDK